MSRFNWKKISDILLIVVLLAIGIKLFYYHFKIITYPFALEFREGAMLATTDLMLKGGNPFALEHQPIYTNIYGILYHLIVYPFAKLAGPTVFVHRAVAAVWILASCLLLIVVMRREKVSWILTLAAAVIFDGSLLFPGTTTALSGPHSLGVFLFMAAVFAPVLTGYSSRGLAGSLLLGVAAYYAKPYFILALPFVAAYLVLFVSKKKGIIYGVLSIILFLLSAAVVRQFYELYFHNTLVINYELSLISIPHMWRQFGEYARLHAGLLGAWLVLIFSAAKTAALCWERIREGWSQKITANLTDGDAPLVQPGMSLYAFGLAVFTLLTYVHLGRHGGSWMAYLFHLISPFFLPFVFIRIARSTRWKTTMAGLVMVNLMVMGANHADTFERDFSEWQKLDTLISRHQMILNSPAVTPMMIVHDKALWDSGLSEFFKLGAYPSALNSLISSKAVNVQIKRRQYEHLVEVMLGIQQKRFDLIILAKDFSPFALFTPESLEKDYVALGILELQMPHSRQNWKLLILLPRQ